MPGFIFRRSSTGAVFFELFDEDERVLLRGVDRGSVTRCDADVAALRAGASSEGLFVPYSVGAKHGFVAVAEGQVVARSPACVSAPAVLMAIRRAKRLVESAPVANVASAPIRDQAAPVPG